MDINVNATPITSAVTYNAARQVFAPMFRARWQNYQNIVNDTPFINQVPANLRTYYQAFIFQWMQWARGFVPGLHQYDFFSTGMGYTVCDVFARLCMTGGFRVYSDDGKTKTFIEEWCKRNSVESLLNKMFFFSNAGGNALVVLTPIDGEVYPSVYPITRALFTIGRNNVVSEAVLFNRFTTGEQTGIYARETRRIFDGKGYYRVELAESGLALAPSWGGMTLSKIPERIKAQFKYTYGDIQPGKWYALPEKMRNLGVYNVRNKSVAVALADLPGYSDSTLHTALDVLYSIDYNYTQAQVDQYLAKSRGLVPKELNDSPAVTVVDGQPIRTVFEDGTDFRSAMQVRGKPLDETFYDFIPNNAVDGDPLKPYFIQPDLRGEIHKLIRDADLELLASKVGLSSSTLANHLAYNRSGTKTDDEISAENSTDEISVENKRRLALEAIDALLADVAYFYGYSFAAEMKFGQTVNNSARKNQELMTDYQSGTLPLREYLKRRWAELSEEEIEKMAVEIETERTKQNESQIGDLFSKAFGGGDG